MHALEAAKSCPTRQPCPHLTRSPAASAFAESGQPASAPNRGLKERSAVWIGKS